MSDHARVIRIGIPASGLPVTLEFYLEPERRPVWEALRNVNVRAEPGGTLVGQLLTGEQVTELAQVQVQGVTWVQHARGWTAASVLRLVSPAE